MRKHSPHITFRISEEERDDLKQICEEKGYAYSKIIRRLIREFIKNEREKQKDE